MTEESSFHALFLEEMRIIQRSIKDATSAIAAKNGLTPFQSYAIRVLNEHDGLSIKELSRHLCVAPSNFTPLVRELEEAGYARREQDAGDRRSYRLWITEAGKEKARLIGEGMDEAFGGSGERARELQVRVLDGVAAYHELMGLASFDHEAKQ